MPGSGSTNAPWRGAIQAGLLPISIGLIAASGFVVASVAVHNLTAVRVIAVTAAVTFMTQLNPLWILPQPRCWALTGRL
jgi:chromate transporter